MEIIGITKTSLESSMTIKGREFSIPVDTKLGLNLNDDTMLEWKAEHFNISNYSDLAEELETYFDNVR